MISVGEDSVHFSQSSLSTLKELSQAILKSNWTPGSFKDSYRTKANFIEASCFALDIDGGLPLKEAIGLFYPYRHIIATTRSHQKEKHGVVADRYRVVLFFERTANQQEFEATLRKLSEGWSFIDKACLDASRFFYPSNEVVSVSDGALFRVEAPQPIPTYFRVEPREAVGSLSRQTLEFLSFGAKDGEWNHRLFKAAVDALEQGYSEEAFIEKAEKVTGHLDSNDLRTINSAYGRAPRYEARLLSQAEVSTLLEKASTEPLILTPSELVGDVMGYLSNKDEVRGQPTYLKGLDELLGGGKRLGEVTALCAEGKTGKNAIWHYLMHLWIEKGIPFGYASRELTPSTEVLPDFLSMAFKENARLAGEVEVYRDYLVQLDGLVNFSIGRGYYPIEKIEEWVKALKERGVSYFFIDHLHWCLEDPEDYKAASILSRVLKDLAVRHNVHIDVIIQPKVLMDGQKPSLNSMKGGSAIGQNIDNFLTLERIGEPKENLSKLTLKAKRSRLASCGSIVLHYDSNSLLLSEMELDETPAPLKLHAIE